MNVGRFGVAYIGWHYTRGYGDFVRVARNLLWFLYHFFSIPVLLRTFFNPFERVREPYAAGLDLGQFFTSLLFNIIMRAVGMVARSILMLMGIVIIAVSAVLAALAFVLWALAPLAVLVCCVDGLTLIATSV